MQSVQREKSFRQGRMRSGKFARLTVSLLLLLALVPLLTAKEAGAALVPLACGRNDSGQLGNGSIALYSITPTPIVGLPGGTVVKIGGGYNFSLALMDNGRLWAWGDNSFGQLGNGGATSSTVAVPVPGLSDIVDIDAGESYALAVRSDGTVWAWGNNANGQCGNGSTVNQPLPAQVKDATDPTGFLTGVRAVAAGSSASYALKRDGTIRAWGQGNGGLLGYGGQYAQYTAVPVANLSGVIAIAAGAVHGMALREDGSVWTWGFNTDGQIGDSIQWTLFRFVPVQVEDPTDPTGYLTDITAIAAGSTQSFALKADRTVRSWGKNHYGALGNPDYYSSRLPVVVAAPYGTSGAFTGVVAIVGGYNHTLAIRADGSAWGWGQNTLGSLAWPNLSSRITRPVQIFPPATDVTAGTVVVGAGSSHSLFVVDIFNRPPVANAGADRMVTLGSPAYLDGSASSDPDPGDYVLHSWEVVSLPPGSTTVLFNANSALPHFTADVPGTYVFRLVVTDSHGASGAPDEVSVSTLNVTPTADAGPDQTAGRGVQVLLDGSASHDPDSGDALIFGWQLAAAPPGSAAALIGALDAQPSFVPDLPGDYRVVLVVTDGSGAASAPDEVVVHVFNQRPVADAGPDQSVLLLGSVVQLDGTQSWDGDGDPLAQAWVFSSLPAGSAAVLSDPAAAAPSFTADVNGEYVLKLVASDPWESSEPDTVTVSFSNVPPVADAGRNLSVVAGDTVCLDGSGSHDANLDLLTYSWSLAEVPAGSLAALSDASGQSPGFVADLPGTYVVTLVVSDGIAESAMSSATVTAITTSDALLNLLQELIRRINLLDDGAFKNPNMRHALTNKVNAVISQVIAGARQGARGQLANDLFAKTDGCAGSGAPDNNDWLTNCGAQGQIQPLIVEALGLLDRMPG